MRNTVIAAVAAFILGGVTTGVLLAQAQPAPPPDAPAGRPPGGPWMGRGMGPWAEQMRERHARHEEMRRNFALVLRADDRKLTPPDVQKIAEAFLLWNGNHSWKVINVATEGDVIGFSLATADGSVIAQYTMDPKTGHLNRRG